MLKPSSHIIRGTRYAVRECGRGEAVLLLHGFTGSGEVFEPFFNEWSNHFHLIAPDLLGHGLSEAPSRPTRYKMEETLADLVALLDQFGIARAHVVGYSMGGRIALALASTQPDKTAKVLLEGASPGLRLAGERELRIAADEAMAADIEREGVAAFVRKWEAIPLFESQQRLPKSILENQRRIRLSGQAMGYAGSLRGIGTGSQLSYWESLPRLSKETLLITGALDRKFTALNAQMASSISSCRHVVMQDAGHSPHIEQPGQFSSIALGFLNQSGHVF